MNFLIAKTSHSSLFVPVEQGKLKGLQVVNNKALKIKPQMIFKNKN